jgi:SAM-dependent methyltransferase
MNVGDAPAPVLDEDRGTAIVQVCPACSATDWTDLPGEGPGFDFEKCGMRFAPPPYSIRECARCGLLYKSAVLSDDALARYYSLLEPTKWDIAGYTPPEREILKVLRALPPRSRILDFGCSTGRLLSSLASVHERFGVEPNEQAARLASDKGIRILSEAEFADCRERFDIVILSDVVEHLSTPTQTMDAVWRTLAPKGRLLISTGNGDHAACRREPATFWYFVNPEHLCMLTRRYAQFLTARLGAELTGWTELCHYDFDLPTRLRQKAQDFAYWTFRRGSGLSRTVLGKTPVMNRARQWRLPPTYSCSKDHVLVTFSRSDKQAAMK